MVLRRVLLSMAVAASVVMVPTAGASPGSWRMPARDLSAPGADGDHQQVVVAPDGTTTVVWQRYEDTIFSNTLVQASTRPPGGEFGPPVDLSAAGAGLAGEPQVAVAPDGATTVVWRRWDGSNTIVQASTRPSGGAFGAPVDLSAAGQNVIGQQLAVAPDGTTTALWSRWDGSNFIVQARTRPPGGAFGPTVDLSAAGQDAAVSGVGVAPDGTTTVVLNRSGLVEARTRPPGGVFDAPVDVSAPGQHAGAASLAVERDGTTTVVWSGSDGANQVIQASTRPAGGDFGSPVDLSEPGQDAFAPRVAVAPDATTTAAWFRSDGTDSIVQASTRPADGTFGTPADLSDAGDSSFDPQLAVAPDGATTVVWRSSNGGQAFVQASTRAAGADEFSAPTDLSVVGQEAMEPQVALAPDGTATVVWHRWDGTDRIVQAITNGGPPVPAEPRPAAPPSVTATTASVTPRPLVRALPKISGLARVGRTLRCRAAAFTGAGRRVTTWTRSGRRIRGATGPRYRITRRDVGKVIRCLTTGSGPGGTNVAVSRGIRVRR